MRNFMGKLIKDYVLVEHCGSLSHLIEKLTALRDSLPADVEPDVIMRGDDNFGRHLRIGYHRPQTAEEAACEARHAEAVVRWTKRELVSPWHQSTGNKTQARPGAQLQRAG